VPCTAARCSSDEHTYERLSLWPGRGVQSRQRCHSSFVLQERQWARV
jgi:hypothetical protein